MAIKNWGTGPLSLSEIKTEFGGGSSISLNNYYAGGPNVYLTTFGNPNGVSTNLPTSGPISISNFYGSSKLLEIYGGSASVGTRPSVSVPPGTWNVLIRLVGGGGGGGGSDSDKVGAPGGYGVSVLVRFRISSPYTSSIRLFVGGGASWGSSNARSPVTTNGGVSGAMGYFSGNFDLILNGGHGGSSGSSGASGSGGGGGGASAIGWKYDATLSDSTEQLIALAGGGGGGTGSGNYSIITPGTISYPNLNNRFYTTSAATLANRVADVDRYSVSGTAYRLANMPSDGQGSRNIRNYYPPGPTDAVAIFDGGGGGGGGGGNGHGGGLTKSANNTYKWIYDTFCDKYGCTGPIWSPPRDFCGAGGGAGFAFAEFSATYCTYTSLSYSNEGSYNNGYGIGGNAAGAGTTGYAAVKVTNNLSDNSFPA